MLPDAAFPPHSAVQGLVQCLENVSTSRASTGALLDCEPGRSRGVALGKETGGRALRRKRGKGSADGLRRNRGDGGGAGSSVPGAQIMALLLRVDGCRGGENSACGRKAPSPLQARRLP